MANNEINKIQVGTSGASYDIRDDAARSALKAKANSSDVYTKTQTDSLLSAKANSSDVYTKTQTDSLLSAKANSSNVYSKSEIDSSFSRIATYTSGTELLNLTPSS